MQQFFYIFVINIKVVKENLGNTPVPSASEEEHDVEEIKRNSTKTSNTGKVAAALHQKRKTVRSQQQASSQLVSSVDQTASV